MLRIACQCNLLRKTRFISSAPQALCSYYATKSNAEAHANGDDDNKVREHETLDKKVVPTASEIIEKLDSLPLETITGDDGDSNVSKKPKKKDWKQRKKKKQQKAKDDSIQIENIKNEFNELRNKPGVNATLDFIKKEVDFEDVGAIKKLQTLLKTLHLHPELVAFFTKNDGEQLKTIILSDISSKEDIDTYNVKKTKVVVENTIKEDKESNLNNSTISFKNTESQPTANLHRILGMVDIGITGGSGGTAGKIDKGKGKHSSDFNKKLSKDRRGNKNSKNLNVNKKTNNQVTFGNEPFYAEKRKKVFVDLDIGPMTTLFEGLQEFDEEHALALSLHEIAHTKYLKSAVIPNKFAAMTLSLERQWNFPINNDQDTEFTEPFSEHVFLDHLLEEFPDIASIQKYMELVISGLQQNPYLSAEEKVKKIMWHKEYFESFSQEEISVAR